jgi:hypothetical protein
MRFADRGKAEGAGEPAAFAPRFLKPFSTYAE